MEETEPKDPPLDRSDLELLIEDGVIPAEHRDSALAAFQEEISWKAWIRLWSGALGSIFFLAGVLFFFASNWKEMSPLFRLGILETGVVGTIVAACFCGIRSSVGQWLLVGASVLTGILLAVYGQVYQTGADAFEVFALWTGLMLAWVVLARFAPLWIFWLMIAETALCLYFGQVPVPDGSLSWASAFLCLSLFTAGFLFLWEQLQIRPGMEWLSGEWIRVALAGATVFWLSMIPWRWIFDFGNRNDAEAPMLLFGTLVWVAGMGFGIWFFQNRRASLLSLSLCILSPAVIAICWLARLILDSGSESAIEFLMIGLVGILLFGGAATLILRAGRRMAANELETK